jgi:hypothetical protein
VSGPRQSPNGRDIPCFLLSVCSPDHTVDRTVLSFGGYLSLRSVSSLRLLVPRCPEHPFVALCQLAASSSSSSSAPALATRLNGLTTGSKQALVAWVDASRPPPPPRELPRLLRSPGVPLGSTAASFGEIDVVEGPSGDSVFATSSVPLLPSTESDFLRQFAAPVGQTDTVRPAQAPSSTLPAHQPFSVFAGYPPPPSQSTLPTHPLFPTFEGYPPPPPQYIHAGRWGFPPTSLAQGAGAALWRAAARTQHFPGPPSIPDLSLLRPPR